MLISREVSRAIESCIASSHVSVTNRYNELGEDFSFQRIGSGIANFSGHDSFLSQVIGWGFDASEIKISQQLAEIEKFYTQLNHKEINIELSPLCGNTVVEILTQNGYKVSEFNNISYLELDKIALQTSYEELIIIQTPNTQMKEWAHSVAKGFNCLNVANQFKVYAEANNIIAYHAVIDNQIAAGATIALHNNIADLGVTSTLEKFRGRGLQKALIETRLNYAKEQGVNLATVTTEPGSVSDLNIQKCGFQCAYTRVKFTKTL